MKDISLIRCGKHQEWRPWSIVCIHLCEGKASEWIPRLQEGRDQYDWLCPECIRDFDRMIDEIDVSQIRPVCVECVKDLRIVYDRNYKLQL